MADPKDALVRLRELCEAAMDGRDPIRWARGFQTFDKVASAEMVMLLIDCVEAADKMRRRAAPPSLPRDATDDYDAKRAALARKLEE